MKAYERLIRYAKVSTASEEGIGRSPSTEQQFDLARILVDELRELGIADAELTDSCYVYVKEIIKGETDSPLGKEEEKAVRIALGLEKPEY